MTELRRSVILFGALLAAMLVSAAGLLLLPAYLSGDGESAEGAVIFIVALLPSIIAVLAGSVVGFGAIANRGSARREWGLLTSVLTAGILAIGEVILLGHTSLVRGDPLPLKLVVAVVISGLCGVVIGALAGRLHGSR